MLLTDSSGAQQSHLALLGRDLLAFDAYSESVVTQDAPKYKTHQKASDLYFALARPTLFQVAAGSQGGLIPVHQSPAPLHLDFSEMFNRCLLDSS